MFEPPEGGGGGVGARGWVGGEVNGHRLWYGRVYSKVQKPALV